MLGAVRWSTAGLIDSNINLERKSSKKTWRKNVIGLLGILCAAPHCTRFVYHFKLK